MKNFKIIFAALIALSLANCEDYDPSVDGSDVPLTVGFARNTVAYQVDPGNPVYRLELNSTQVSNVDRVFTISVDTDATDADGVATTAPSGSFTLPSTITIPAGSYAGFANVPFDFDLAPEGDPVALVVDVTTPDGIVRNNTKSQVVINFRQLCLFTEAQLNITFDDYAEETSYELYDSAFNIVASGGQDGAFDGETTFAGFYCLEDGEYTLVIYDSYGDGITGNGKYSFTVDNEVIITSVPFNTTAVHTFTVGD